MKKIKNQPMPTNKKPSEKIEAELKKIKKTVDPIIMKMLLNSISKKNREIIKYQIEMGGKRLRPALAVLSFRMMGGQTSDILYPAASLEILHNYTLIIDDIIDNSEIRRGRPTVWKKFGNSIAECAAIIFAASIFGLEVKKKNSDKCRAILSRTLKEVSEGEILDILFEQNGREHESYILKNRYKRITQKDYLEMISKKTACLAAACAEMGAVCAGADNQKVKLLKKFGFNLGLAFQVRDDILDIFGEEKKFGKQIGKDIIEGKLGNILILFALGEFDKNRKKTFLALLKKPKNTSQDIKRGVEMIKETGALKKANQLEKNYTMKAKQCLKELPQNQYNERLGQLTDYLLNRQA